mmetsp:Transcript_9863/g.27929  ORF Transcript_9863/g.27929 Transcript_9863/m.27929 type:complete len:205 (-) Transcript_9863:1980-2594(-)
MLHTLIGTLHLAFSSGLPLLFHPLVAGIGDDSSTIFHFHVSSSLSVRTAVKNASSAATFSSPSHPVKISAEIPSMRQRTSVIAGVTSTGMSPVTFSKFPSLSTSILIDSKHKAFGTSFSIHVFTPSLPRWPCSSMTISGCSCVTSARSFWNCGYVILLWMKCVALCNSSNTEWAMRRRCCFVVSARPFIVMYSSATVDTKLAHS